MWLRRPTQNEIDEFLHRQRDLPFNYSDVGATQRQPPAGFTVDRYRISLGRGDAVFHTAKEEIRRWTQFQLGWLTTAPRDAAIRDGQVVAVLAWVLGFWWLNACRIVYTIDGPHQFGFAYGTLPGHAAIGEERFMIEFDEHTSEVTYSILAFSKPRHILTWMVYPYTRRVQRSFGRGSCSAMVRAVSARIV